MLRRCASKSAGLRLVVMLGLLMGAGCGLTFIPIDPADLPAELAAVFAAPETFNTSQPSPLKGVTPGTVVEPLTGLDGCWGLYEVQRVADPNHPAIGVDVADLYECWYFDAETGACRRAALVTNSPFLPDLLTQSSGTFEFAADGILRVTVTDWRINDPRTGAPAALPAEFTEEYVVDHPASLAGDSLLLADPNNVDYDTGELIPYLFRRFDCPE